jgi:hypothetical protein
MLDLLLMPRARGAASIVLHLLLQLKEKKLPYGIQQ